MAILKFDEKYTSCILIFHGGSLKYHHISFFRIENWLIEQCNSQVVWWQGRVSGDGGGSGLAARPWRSQWRCSGAGLGAARPSSSLPYADPGGTATTRAAPMPNRVGHMRATRLARPTWHSYAHTNRNKAASCTTSSFHKELSYTINESLWTNCYGFCASWNSVLA